MLASAVGLLIYSAGQFFWFNPTGASQERGDRKLLATAKQEAYRWIRSRTEPRDRFIAYEDVSLFLHTGRQSLRPMAFSTAAFYQQNRDVVDRDLNRLGDTARELGARYWVTASDDFDLETAEEVALDYMRDFIGAYPVVFESQDGRIRIHDVWRLQSSQPSARWTIPTTRLPGTRPEIPGASEARCGAGAGQTA